MTALREDLRFALRLIARRPGTAAVVVLTLGIGIGASAIVGVAAEAVLNRPLPYPDAERLVFVSRAYPGFPQGGGNFSYPASRDIGHENTSFDAFVAYQTFGSLALSDEREAVRVTVNYTEPGYLKLLGVRPALGRLFRPEEDRFVDADPVLILSHDFWKRQFAGAPDIVGRTVVLNQTPLTVVGVAPESFRDALAELESRPPVDAWIPLGAAPKLLQQFIVSDRASAILWGIGRLKPGVTVAQARADIAGIGQRLSDRYPGTDRGFGLVARPLKDQIVGGLYVPVRLLAAGAICLLLIGCANAASLQLARLVARRGEFAVRRALGARPGRLVRQLLAENLVLASLAGLVALLLSFWGIRALDRFGRASLSPILDFQPDARGPMQIVAFTLLAGLLFGLAPALSGARARDGADLQRAGRQGETLGRRRLARLLVAGEIALALVLLASAGLLSKSFQRLTARDLGFPTKDLLTLRLDLRTSRYAEESSRVAFARHLEERLASLPGVASATLWGPSMLGRATWVVEACAEGLPDDDPKNIIMSWRHSVNPGALANLGIRLLSGRDVSWDDDASKPRVAVVSESTAKAHWPGQDPIGKRFRYLRAGAWVTVIGVAADARHRTRLDLADAAIGIPPSGLGPQRDVYFPYAQLPNRALAVALRVEGGGATLAAALRAAVRQLDPTLPVYEVAWLDDLLDEQDRGSRVMTILSGSYALLALGLCALGLFGLLAHAVGERTREIGIRGALGARPRDLVRMVLADGLGLTGLGIAAGLAAALALTRFLESVLFGVSPGDASVLAGVCLVLFAVAACACWVPARRAASLDPLRALRTD